MKHETFPGRQSCFGNRRRRPFSFYVAVGDPFFITSHHLHHVWFCSISITKTIHIFRCLGWIRIYRKKTLEYIEFFRCWCPSLTYAQTPQSYVIDRCTNYHLSNAFLLNPIALIEHEVLAIYHYSFPRCLIALRTKSIHCNSVHGVGSYVSSSSIEETDLPSLDVSYCIYCHCEPAIQAIWSSPCFSTYGALLSLWGRLSVSSPR